MKLEFVHYELVNFFSDDLQVIPKKKYMMLQKIHEGNINYIICNLAYSNRNYSLFAINMIYAVFVTKYHI
jgi:hypothetical protein